jgi:hypothetical protein
MSICKQSPRDKSLDMALTTGIGLQNALSSMKHGMSRESETGVPITIRSLLSGGGKGTRTMTIHHGSNKYMVSYIWYSLSTVRLNRIMSAMDSTGGFRVLLDKTRMCLYVITVDDVAKGISNNNKDIIVTDYGNIDANLDYIILLHPPSDIANRLVRITDLDCTSDSWTVIEKNDTVFTVFRGDKFANVMQRADVTLSTDVNITVSYIGKVNAAILYTRYLREQGADLYVASMLCLKSSGINTYDTISSSSPLKRISVRKQIDTLVEASIDDMTDDLTSIESKLLAGRNIDTDIANISM